MDEAPKDFGAARTLARDELWQGSIGSFGIDEVQLADGRRMQLALLRHPGAAAVVPFVDSDTILMLRQFRYATGQTIWEIPAGKLDPGEAPLRCAQRELEEETGYRAGRLESLGHIFTTPGFTDEVIHLFSAYELSAGQHALDADEALEAAPLPFEQALEMIARGEITDAKTICALFHAQRRRPAAR